VLDDVGCLLLWLFVLIAYQLLVAVGHRVCGWKRKNERKTTFGVSPYSFIHSFIHLSHEIFERSLDTTDLSFVVLCCPNSEQSPPRNNVQNNAPHPIRRPSTKIYNEIAGALPSNQSSSP